MQCMLFHTRAYIFTAHGSDKFCNFGIFADTAFWLCTALLTQSAFPVLF